MYVVKLKPNLLSSVLVHHGGLCMVEGVHAALEYTAAVGGIGMYCHCKLIDICDLKV